MHQLNLLDPFAHLSPAKSPPPMGWGRRVKVRGTGIIGRTVLGVSCVNGVVQAYASPGSVSIRHRLPHDGPWKGQIRTVQVPFKWVEVIE